MDRREFMTLLTGGPIMSPVSMMGPRIAVPNTLADRPAAPIDPEQIRTLWKKAIDIYEQDNDPFAALQLEE